MYLSYNTAYVISVAGHNSRQRKKIDLVADMLTKPFSRLTFQEKLDIVRKWENCQRPVILRTSVEPWCHNADISR